jgi:S1-C subfamily serine protease
MRPTEFFRARRNHVPAARFAERSQTRRFQKPSCHRATALPQAGEGTAGADARRVLAGYPTNRDRRIAARCRAAGVLTATALTVCLLTTGGWAAEEIRLSVEQQAELLQRVTVTVRVTLSDDEVEAVAGEAGQASSQADPETTRDAAPVKASRVSVCSGISLGQGLIVTSLYAGSDSRIRITLPGGEQAAARLSVIDDYSGLVLLEIERQDLPGIPLAEQAPPVGRQIVMAAAWGSEKPVISQGIVSPPLIQCDVRSAETASGAGLVDAGGQLLGIVVLADQPDRLRGWTYAVPAAHVQRLVQARAARVEPSAGGAAGSESGVRDNFVPGGSALGSSVPGSSVIVLKRRRPLVGMVLGGDADDVTVRRVEPNSPADRAGIRVGDRILAAEGVQIRSVYEAVRPVLFKQPGDRMQYLVQQKDARRSIDVTLGGGVELPSATLENLGQYVRPKIDIEGLAQGRFRSSSARGEVREVFAGDPDQADAETDPRLVTNAEKLQMLERALEAYRSVIVYQQKELGRRDVERKELEEQLRLLQDQLKSLQQRPAK